MSLSHCKSEFGFERSPDVQSERGTGSDGSTLKPINIQIIRFFYLFYIYKQLGRMLFCVFSDYIFAFEGKQNIGVDHPTAQYKRRWYN